MLLAAAAALALAGCGGSASRPAPVQVVKIEEITRDPIVLRPDHYIVQPGDTLIEIALNSGLDFKDIALWNAIADPDRIEVGQRLVLKEPENAPVVRAVATQKIEPAAERIAKPASAVRRIAPETVVIGRTPAPDEQTLAAVGAPAPAIVKTGPKPVSHPYSQEKLDELRSQGEAAIADPDELAYAPSAAEPAAKAPKERREKFGNEWSWPVADKPNVLDVYSDERRGINIGGNAGDAVFASAAGEVLYAGAGMKGYGNLIVIRHDNDYVSAYGNNQDMLVSAQDKVARGQVIARMGDSGANRVQLHFEIRKSGKPLNPEQFVPPLP
jgi:lipoprotein NlpD